MTVTNPSWRQGGKRRHREIIGNDDLMKAILDAAWSKNAFATKVYDVTGVVDYTDMFVILSGRSDRHVMAIAEAVEGQLKELGIRAAGVEGRKSEHGCCWISET